MVALAALAFAGCGSSSHNSAGTTAGSSGTSSGSSVSSTSTAGTAGVSGSSSTVGVTSSTVTIGTVADISGAVPGLFQGGIDGVQAYAAYVNSTGGVNGRKLVVKTADSALNCVQTTNSYKSMISQTFALVGSWSDFDNCAVPVLQANPEVANVSYALSTQMRSQSTDFNIIPAPPGFYTGPYAYLHQQHPGATKIGTVYSSTPAGADTEKYFRQAFGSVGYKFAYEVGIPAIPPVDFTSDVLRLKNAGANYLLLNDLDVGSAARIIDSAYQQGWHPQVIDCSVCYDANFAKLVNPAAAKGVLADQPHALFDGEDQNVVPEVGLFLTWLHKTHPGFQPNLYAMYSWANTALFVDALKRAGTSPTRASLLAALKNTHSFNDNNMVAPGNVGTKTPPTCWVLAEFNNGQWSRVTPKTGYQCTPGGFVYVKS